MKPNIKFLRLTFIMTIVFGLTGTCNFATISAQSHPRKINYSDSCSPVFIRKAQHIIDNYRQRTGAPGIAVAFYDSGKSCLFVSGDQGDSQHTPVTGETDFAMGSIEKVFSSTLLAISINQGKANIDDPAAKYLVAGHNKKVKPNAPFWNVTLKNLVTHTSSLPRKIANQPQRIGMNLFRDKPMDNGVIQFLDSWAPAYPIGTRYKYSNLGFVLVGRAAVTLGGKVYTKLLKENITGPLGMSRTGMLCIANPPVSGCAVAYEPNGQPSKKMPVGLWTTADDMLQFIEANLGVLKPSQELAKAIDLTHKKLFKVDSVHTIGMGWERWYHGDSLLISKDGADSGFSSWVGFEPNKQRGVVVLSNGGKKPEPGMLGKRLLSLTELQH
ncbi:MAG TPA: serine hydrolase [Hanamia sp.]|nr:serine hydrolase [Hanamia sp.]